MSIEIRRLDTSEYVQFTDLLRTERDGQDSILWQDRSPDLLRIFEPYIQGKPIYFGAFVDGKLVGGTGLIPVVLRDGLRASMDTDFFVAPAFRQSRVGYGLARFRAQDSFSTATDFHFGIEETNQQLQSGVRLGKALGVVFDFVGQTTLRHDYFLHSKPTKEFDLNGVKILAIADLSEAEKRTWLNSRSAISPLSPRLEVDIFDKLIQLDPEAKAILVSDGSRAILLSQSRARKFRASKNQNLMLTKLARFRGEDLGPDAELRMGILGLVVPGQSAGASLNNLFQGVGHLAFQKKFHVLVSRDLGISGPSILSADTAEFQRRIFMNYRHGDKNAEQCRREVENTGGGRLDSLFL